MCFTGCSGQVRTVLSVATTISPHPPPPPSSSLLLTTNNIKASEESPMAPDAQFNGLFGSRSFFFFCKKEGKRGGEEEPPKIHPFFFCFWP